MIDDIKRKMDRYHLKVPARITVRDKSAATLNEPVFYLTTSNVCAGGAYFKTGRRLQMGTKLDIDMHLTINFPTKTFRKLSCVHVTGRIIRVEDDGMAVQFNKSYRFLPVENAQ